MGLNAPRLGRVRGSGAGSAHTREKGRGKALPKPA